MGFVGSIVFVSVGWMIAFVVRMIVAIILEIGVAMK